MENAGDPLVKHLNMSLDNKILVMHQIAKGIKFIHQSNVIHRDLKLDNIFIKNPEHPQIKSLLLFFLVFSSFSF